MSPDGHDIEQNVEHVQGRGFGHVIGESDQEDEAKDEDVGHDLISFRDGGWDLRLDSIHQHLADEVAGEITGAAGSHHVPLHITDFDSRPIPVEVVRHPDGECFAIEAADIGQVSCNAFDESAADLVKGFIHGLISS